MTTEEQLRFGLCLPKDKPIVDAIFDLVDQMNQARQKERDNYRQEIGDLRAELDEYKWAHLDQYLIAQEYNDAWRVIDDYNRSHLTLDEAIRQYIRNKEWNYTANPYLTTDRKTTL